MKRFKILAIAAVFAIAFGFAACDNDPSDNGNGRDPNLPALTGSLYLPHNIATGFSVAPHANLSGTGEISFRWEILDSEGEDGEAPQWRYFSTGATVFLSPAPVGSPPRHGSTLRVFATRAGNSGTVGPSNEVVIQQHMIGFMQPDFRITSFETPTGYQPNIPNREFGIIRTACNTSDAFFVANAEIVGAYGRQEIQFAFHEVFDARIYETLTFEMMADTFDLMGAITGFHPRFRNEGDYAQSDSTSIFTAARATLDPTESPTQWVTIEAIMPTGAIMNNVNVMLLRFISNPPGELPGRKYFRNFQLTYRPVHTGSVTISGPTNIGGTLTADTSGVLGGTGPFTYVWQHSATGVTWPVVDGAPNQNTLVTTTAVANRYVRVVVNRAGYLGIASNSIRIDDLPPLTGTVTVTGTPAPGQTLTADVSAVGGASGLISQRWQFSPTGADGSWSDIAGIAGSGLTWLIPNVPATWVGRHVRVSVTRAGYSGAVVSTPKIIVP